VWTRAWRPARSVAARAGALLLTLVALVALAWPRAAHADEAQALDQVRAAFDAGKYGEARALLADLFKATNPPCEGDVKQGCRLKDPQLLERAHAYDAAALLGLGKVDEADKVIGDVFRNNPSYVPSTSLFPQEVADHFWRIRAKMDPELRQIIEKQQREAEAKREAEKRAHQAEEAWIAEIQSLAKRERFAQTNSRFIALIPFGLGQFQNGDTGLGIFFATSEILTATASIVPFVLSYNLAAQAPASTAQIVLANTRFNAYRIVNGTAFGLWGGLVLTGVIHAQVTFQPERVTFRDRTIPERPPKPASMLVPFVAPIPQGAIVGLGGTF
jgi:hypothetical protein